MYLLLKLCPIHSSISFIQQGWYHLNINPEKANYRIRWGIAFFTYFGQFIIRFNSQYFIQVFHSFLELVLMLICGGTAQKSWKFIKIKVFFFKHMAFWLWHIFQGEEFKMQLCKPDPFSYSYKYRKWSWGQTEKAAIKKCPFQQPGPLTAPGSASPSKAERLHILTLWRHHAVLQYWEALH